MTAKTAKFWDGIADRYAQQPIADEAAYAHKLSVTQSYMRPDMDIVEFGCGTGSTAIAHAPFVASIRAIDFSDNMLAIARKKADAAGVANITFERGDIAEPDIAPASVDMVLGLSLLHLLRAPDAAIANVFEMLKPGGVFVTSTTCLGDTMAWIKYFAPLGQALGKLPQLTVMRADTLVESFQNAGFEIAYRWQPDPKKALFVIARKPG